jgi:hypothetical protein
LAPADASSVSTTRSADDETAPTVAADLRRPGSFDPDFLKPHVLQASVNSLSALPNETGVIQATTNSVPH